MGISLLRLEDPLINRLTGSAIQQGLQAFESVRDERGRGEDKERIQISWAFVPSCVAENEGMPLADRVVEGVLLCVRLSLLTLSITCESFFFSLCGHLAILQQCPFLTSANTPDDCLLLLLRCSPSLMTGDLPMVQLFLSSSLCLYSSLLVPLVTSMLSPRLFRLRLHLLLPRRWFLCILGLFR